MKRFFKDVTKFNKYLFYAAKSDLKTEVADSKLSWLWWILDPLLFMLVYTFISLVVFSKSMPYFPVFVFIGLTVWNFFNKTMKFSVKAVRLNSSIISKIYVPKYIFIIQQMFVNAFKMFVSFAIIVIMMACYRVHVTWRVVYVLPLLFTLFMITFAFSTLVLHCGVFLNDLANVLDVILRLMFYMSGVFFSISDRVPAPYGTLMLVLNPTACIMDGFRNCLLYECDPNLPALIGWSVGGFVLAMLGVAWIYRNENVYAKVM